MVKNITAFGRSGLSDWLVQRVTSIVVASYVFFLLGFFILCGPVTFIDWFELFASLSVRIYSLLTLICLLIHAWIGIWTVITDYVKPVWARATAEVVTILALAVYMLWGTYLLFG